MGLRHVRALRVVEVRSLLLARIEVLPAYRRLPARQQACLHSASCWLHPSMSSSLQGACRHCLALVLIDQIKGCDMSGFGRCNLVE